MEFINAVLESDRKAPRKQRHTNHRIYERIRMEFPEHPVGESTINHDSALTAGGEPNQAIKSGADRMEKSSSGTSIAVNVHLLRR